VTEESSQPGSSPFELPIEGVLDLHTFRPQDVKDVVLSYLEECRARGVLEVRVVHGKGIGQLRQTVHAVLAKTPWIASYAIAGPAYGGSGATMVRIQPLAKQPDGTAQHRDRHTPPRQGVAPTEP
jgi:DNA-nicking Smr family endonuclease